ncbi:MULTISPECIES: hypothetical protein [Streptomyces]|uniref:hypothetical protein n=1 Tax=Streptomyces TaxID=1883 RepID=UPI000D0C7A23|nr:MULTISPECIES: hypothetical protein [unclassified Streptomyces]MBQ0951097.1 hypothetical protein [Streptomyces sp. RK76]WTC49346.1 hypothetical protein OG855_16960 [Streptomyces anthocyanicus]
MKVEEFWPIIDIEYVDAYPWVIIPPRAGTSAPFEEWEDIHGWCLERAEDLWTDRQLDPGPSGVPFVGETLARCAEALCPPGSDHWLFLHLDHPTDIPLPVCAAIGPARESRETTLRALTEADDTAAVEPPVVKSFSSPYLGAGTTTFRYVLQEESPHLAACVRYAWQVEKHGADVVIWTGTEDVARILNVADDVEELARSLAIFVP